jgi:endonuclease YncB( thermonuclease family)
MRILNFMALGCGIMIGLVVLYGLLETMAGGGGNTGSPPKQENGTGEHRRYDAVATVNDVVDGDTLRIASPILGDDEVSLIGVDTPETRDHNGGEQPYGERASRFTKSVLDGKKVRLEFDVERKDHYGHLLAYVYPMGDEMLNEVLLRKGYAQLYTVQPNDEHQGKFAGEQENAREGDLGIWGLREAQRCELANHGNGIGKGSPACKAGPNPPPKIESKRKHEHAPAASSGTSAGPDLDCSDLTYRQAQAEMAADPSDPFDLDVDGDGVACEGLRNGGDAASAAATASAASSVSASPKP